MAQIILELAIVFDKCIYIFMEVVRLKQALQHFIPPQLNMLVILVVSFSISDICLIFCFLLDRNRIPKNVYNLKQSMLLMNNA